jgi:hypothetical protein
MDKWSAVFTAIGGLAAVGGLIDLALYKSEKEKLKARLGDWWLRFSLPPLPLHGLPEPLRMTIDFEADMIEEMLAR